MSNKSSPKEPIEVEQTSTPPGNDAKQDDAKAGEEQRKENNETSPKENGSSAEEGVQQQAQTATAKPSPKDSNGNQDEVPETVSPGEVLLKAKPEKPERTYNTAEFVSFVIYVLLAIIFVVIAALEFAHKAEVNLNTAAQEWEASSEEFHKEAAPQITGGNWSIAAVVTAANETRTYPFSVQQEQVRIHPFAKNFDSVYMQANVAASFLALAGGDVTVVFATERNNFYVTRTITQNFTSKTITGCNTGSDCTKNTTEACVSSFGVLSAPMALDTATNTLTCALPNYNGQSCVILQSRKNDTGALNWWVDFDLDGCAYPFTSTASLTATFLRTEVDTLPIKVFVKNDPNIQKSIHAEGKSFPIKVTPSYAGASDSPFLIEKHDRTPEAVGIALLALLMIVGSGMMGYKLIPYAVKRLKEGKSIVEDQGATPQTDTSRVASLQASRAVSRATSRAASPQNLTSPQNTEGGPLYNGESKKTR